MNSTRLYMGSVVLPDGRLFVCGGEYGSNPKTAEIYNPSSNTWTYTATPPISNISDSTAILLPTGSVMVAPASGTVLGNVQSRHQ